MQEHILKNSGLKITESRKLVLKALEEGHDPMTAEDIYKQVRQQHALNFSTVYRILSALTEKNITFKSVGSDGLFYYQLKDHNHSHYLVCSECHKRVSIEGCPLHEIDEKLTEKTGFNITGHNLEFIGECPECIRKKKR